jgi:hypothetical protein
MFTLEAREEKTRERGRWAASASSWRAHARAISPWVSHPRIATGQQVGILALP